MSSWAQNQQYPHQMYGGYGAFTGGYPSVTASGSPMNYGAYYSPGSGYGPAQPPPPYPGTNSFTPTRNFSYGQQATPGANNGNEKAGGNKKSGGNDQSSGNGLQDYGSASQNDTDNALSGGMGNISLHSK